MGDPDGAIQDFDRSIRIKGDFAEFYANRGSAKRILGDPAGAIADYERALLLDLPAGTLRTQVEATLRALRQGPPKGHRP